MARAKNLSVGQFAPSKATKNILRPKGDDNKIRKSTLQPRRATDIAQNISKLRKHVSTCEYCGECSVEEDGNDDDWCKERRLAETRYVRALTSMLAIADMVADKRTQKMTWSLHRARKYVKIAAWKQASRMVDVVNTTI
jgi:hypothetical protein